MNEENPSEEDPQFETSHVEDDVVQITLKKPRPPSMRRDDDICAPKKKMRTINEYPEKEMISPAGMTGVYKPSFQEGSSETPLQDDSEDEHRMRKAQFS